MTAAERAAYAAKRAVAYVLYGLGILQLVQAIVLRRRAVVLMYHRVLADAEREQAGSHPALVVSRDSFAMQMALLKRRFRVLSLGEFEATMTGGAPLPDSSCLITFDDGWRDNLTNAWPVLREHGLPALVFLPVNFIGSRRVFWQEALAHLLRRAIAAARESAEGRRRLGDLLAPAGLAGVLDGPDDGPAFFAAIGSQKRQARQEVEALLEALAGELGLGLEDFAETDGFISWEEAQALARQGVTFGAHGVEHRLLTLVPLEDARHEIRDSRRILGERLGTVPSTFSYPNGYLNDDVVAEVRQAGYGLAFGTTRGLVGSQDERFTIRRLNVHEAATDSPPMFLARLVGLW